jgi:hypothetical protein
MYFNVAMFNRTNRSHIFYKKKDFFFTFLPDILMFREFWGTCIHIHKALFFIYNIN